MRLQEQSEKKPNIARKTAKSEVEMVDIQNGFLGQNKIDSKLELAIKTQARLRKYGMMYYRQLELYSLKPVLLSESDFKHSAFL